MLRPDNSLSCPLIKGLSKDIVKDSSAKIVVNGNGNPTLF